MSLPPTTRWLLFALMAATALYGLARLAFVRRADHNLDVAGILMGAGMAGMLVPAANLTTPARWTALFAADTAWLLAVRTRQAIRRRRRPHARARIQSWGHYTHHIAANLAMLAMLAPAVLHAMGASPAGPAMPEASASMPAMTANPSMSGMASHGWTMPSTVLAAFAVFFLAEGLWTARQLFTSTERHPALPSTARRRGPAPLLSRPRLATGLHVVMSVGMYAMLAEMT